MVGFDFRRFSHPGRATRGHMGWFCHDERELHTLWSVAQDHSRDRVMLVLLSDGPTLPTTAARHNAIGPTETGVGTGSDSTGVGILQDYVSVSSSCSFRDAFFHVKQ